MIHSGSNEKDQPSGLERAMAYRAKHRSVRVGSDEESEVALAWLRDQISLAAAAVGFGLKPNQTGKVYVRISLAIRQSIRSNRIKVSDA